MKLTYVQSNCENKYSKSSHGEVDQSPELSPIHKVSLRQTDTPFIEVTMPGVNKYTSFWEVFAILLLIVGIYLNFGFRK